jgi:hypothetical protein
LIAVLWADAQRGSPLVPKLLSYLGVAVGIAAAASGLGYAADFLQIRLVIGLSVTFGCVVLVVLGAQIARTEQLGQA